MVEEMKVIGTHSPRKGDSEDALTEVMGVVAHSDRSPVLLFMGGGMGAGKSTVLKEVLKEGFWAKAAANAVVVEADAFKETDVIYRALSSKGHHNDMLQTAELVHKTSTDAASSLLVTTFNDGRDVIMDGTLSWEPFVEQTIAMARSVHKHRYRMGVGYKVSDDGTITENYWEKVENGDEFKAKKPYRIEMLGVITHLTIIGYKVSYQQNPLVKYVFKVTDLFNDLKDGVLLCRVIQLLQHDPSIVKKVVISSDDRKKNMANCEIALKYLKKSGVPLHDEDGTEITTEDIVNSDKELVIALLWNIFVHLQLPLLINNKLVSDEITNIRGPEAILPNISIQLEMLLEWIKAICDNHDLKVENLASLVDGKAMWCLLDYYFRKELCNDTSNKELQETNEVSIMSASDYVDAVHNFLLSQKLTTLAITLV